HVAVVVLGRNVARSRQAIGFALRVTPLERIIWRFGRVDPDGVFRDEAAVGRAQAERAGVVAKNVDHRGDGMRDVVVPWATRERQPARDRERTLGSVVPQAEL